MEIEQLLDALVKRADAGHLSPKDANTVKRLQERVAAGRGLSEMQEELLRDLGTEYGTS
jgi:hypothetical protein